MAELQIGEPVYYRGDLKPNRLWRIKAIGSEEFITLETDDVDGIDSIGDTIKVVSPVDIIRISDIPRTSSSLLLHQ